MAGKMKKIYRNLMIRLCVLICVLVMPVNILAVVLTQVISGQYQSEMTRQYKSELNLFVTQKNKELELIAGELAQLVVGDWRRVYGYDDGSQVDYTWKVNLYYQELVDIREEYDIIDSLYLLQPSGETELFTYDVDQYTQEDRDAIYASLQAYDFGTDYGYTYHVLELGGFSFLNLNVNFRNSSFGVLINLNDFFTTIAESEPQQEAVFLLADEEQHILFSTKDGICAGEDVFRPMEAEMMSMPLAGDFYISREIAEKSLMTAMPPLYKVLQTLAIASILVIPLMFVFIRREVISPMRLMEQALHQIEADNLEYRIGEYATTDDFQYLYNSFNDMAEDIKTLTIEAYEKEIEKLSLESTSILLQVSPHMLLNSLNMIYNLAQSRNYECIKDFSLNLSGYFRYVLRKDQTFVTVEQEMRFVANYLEVQKIRYPGAFTSVYQLDEAAKSLLIPPFFIENFVENAVKYALSAEREIEIIIIVRKDADLLKISILDTGNGIEADKLEKINNGEIVEDNVGKHIGIWNCRRRMDMYYGGEGVLRISSKVGEGTQVWMELPYGMLSEPTDVG